MLGCDKPALCSLGTRIWNSTSCTSRVIVFFFVVSWSSAAITGGAVLVAATRLACMEAGGVRVVRIAVCSVQCSKNKWQTQEITGVREDGRTNYQHYFLASSCRFP
jgi:hypothetical protein